MHLRQGSVSFSSKLQSHGPPIQQLSPGSRAPLGSTTGDVPIGDTGVALRLLLELLVVAVEGRGVSVPLRKQSLQLGLVMQLRYLQRCQQGFVFECCPFVSEASPWSLHEGLAHGQRISPARGTDSHLCSGALA